MKVYIAAYNGGAFRYVIQAEDLASAEQKAYEVDPDAEKVEVKELPRYQGGGISGPFQIFVLK